VVLGALLLVVVVLFVSCGGEDNGNQRGTGASSTPPTPAPASSTPEDEPSFADPGPDGGPSLPDPGQIQSQEAGTGTGTGNGADPSAGANNQTGNNANVTAPAGSGCADTEVSVTPVPAATAVKRGTPVVIKLKIKNISNRACSRDLGAGAQELYIDQGARKYWSSDTCSTDRSTNLQRLQPGAEFEYTVTWNGRQSSKCTARLAAGPAPIAGQYEIRGRLGTKVSEPVVLTIVA
jgi:hypothetical protein